MQDVSNAWKAVHRQQLANEGYVEISFDIADPDAVKDAKAKDNGALSISDTKSIVSEVNKNIRPYATLEENLWLLDGNREILPEADYGDNRYIGDIFSKEDGTFENTPFVEVDFSEVHIPIIPGITITWSTTYMEYAEDFKVTAYNGDELVAGKLIKGNSDVMSVVELDIANYNRIRVEILRWCLPKHRPRIYKVFIGVNKVYTKADITKYEHERETSPIGATTPVNKMTFSLDNTLNTYDPNNLTGLSKYLMERQLMRVRYGLMISDEHIEYIPAGVFYLSEWSAPQNGIEASFTARDLLEFMRKIYTKGLYNPQGVSLYELATDILIEAELPFNEDGSKKWIISDTLKNIKTTAPLPLRTLAECLQYIAQVARCIIFCSRSGVLHIEPVNDDITDYSLTEFNLFSRPEISLQKPLKEVSAKVYNYFEGEKGKELFKGSFAVNGTKEVIITYSDKAVNVKAEITDGTLVSAIYYTNTCYLKIEATGEAKIKVIGDILEESTSDYVLNVKDNGEIQIVENPLITSVTIAESVSVWVKDWLSNRKLMTIDDWRADPRLDATDIVSSKNKFTTENMRITSVKYSFAGAFRGSAEGRVI